MKRDKALVKWCSVHGAYSCGYSGRDILLVAPLTGLRLSECELVEPCPRCLSVKGRLVVNNKNYKVTLEAL